MKTIKLSELAPKIFRIDDNKVFSNSNDKANKTVVNLSKNEESMKSTYMLNIKAIEEPTFLISNTKKTFNKLRLAFIKALIFQYFNPESHIRIETDISSYAINKMLS